MPTWYVFNAAKADADQDVATASIFDEIGMWGVTAKDFISDLKNTPAKTLNLEINSPGGSVFDGVAIYNALKNSGKTVNVKVMGVAASIASVIAMAGDSIDMPANTFMMVHNPWGVAVGDSDEMRDYADMLDKIGNSLVSTYMQRTGKSEQEVKDLLNAETWMTAAEAKELGFADTVSDAFEASAKFNLERLPENVRAVFNKVVKPVASAAATTVVPVETVAATTVAAAAPKPVVAFADQVQALADAAALGDYAAQWAVENSEIAAVEARIESARQIVALCVIVKRPDDAANLIKSGKSVAEARTHLIDAMALADEQIKVDTALKNQTQGAPEAGAGFSVMSLWDVRTKNIANRKTKE